MRTYKVTMIVMGLALASLLASCKKNENNNGTASGNGFKALTEQDGNGRTYMDGVAVNWSTGDQIKVYNGAETRVFGLTEGENSTSGSFNTSNGQFYDYSGPFSAAYPSSQVTSMGDATASFSVPATQTFKSGSFGEGAMPMVAYSTDQTLAFKNLFGGLCIPLYGDNLTVKKVVLTTAADEALWGTFDVAISTSGGDPTLGAISNGDATAMKSVTLDCGAGIQLGSTAASATEFYIMVPPGTLEAGFTVTAYNENNVAIFTKSTTTAPGTNFIQRNTVCKVNGSLEIIVIPEKAFSVADGSYVWFSPGNLQYRASADGSGTDLTHAVAGGGFAYGQWRFAEHQYDFVGGATTGNVYIDGIICDNGSTSSTYTGWIDLYGWGTSGWNNGNYFYQPFDKTISNPELYTAENGNGFGPTDGTNYTYDLTGDYANADWGIYNAIYNPITSQTDDPGTWRTLSKEEYSYLLSRRKNDEYLYGEGCIAGVYGCIFLPDDWVLPETMSFTAGVSDFVNEYTAEQWALMESAGAVFLPSAGGRYSSWFGNNTGYYRTSSCNSTRGSIILLFESGYVNTFGSDRNGGRSVRLVRDAN